MHWSLLGVDRSLMDFLTLQSLYNRQKITLGTDTLQNKPSLRACKSSYGWLWRLWNILKP